MLTISAKPSENPPIYFYKVIHDALGNKSSEKQIYNIYIALQNCMLLYDIKVGDFDGFYLSDDKLTFEFHFNLIITNNDIVLKIEFTNNSYNCLAKPCSFN